MARAAIARSDNGRLIPSLLRDKAILPAFIQRSVVMSRGEISDRIGVNASVQRGSSSCKIQVHAIYC
jgi:hypothetical protein